MIMAHDNLVMMACMCPPEVLFILLWILLRTSFTSLQSRQSLKGQWLRFATTLKNPAVRTLAAAMFMPPLIHKCRRLKAVPLEWIGAGYKGTLSKRWLRRLDNAPDPAFVNEANNKQSLGALFEWCIAYAIQRYRTHESAAFRVQVQAFEKKNTLGEMDVLLLAKKITTYHHLELSCKVFLVYDESTELPTHLVSKPVPELFEGEAWAMCRTSGPHKRERLVDAARRVSNQLAFGSTQEAVAAARRALGADRATCAGSLGALRGFVLLPMACYSDSTRRRSSVARGLGGWQGWWVRRAESARLEVLLGGDRTRRKFAILPNTASWLTPVVLVPGNYAMDAKNIEVYDDAHRLHRRLVAIADEAANESPARRDRANRKFVVELVRNAHNGWWVEESRGMVVEDGWPHANGGKVPSSDARSLSPVPTRRL